MERLASSPLFSFPTPGKRARGVCGFSDGQGILCLVCADFLVAEFCQPIRVRARPRPRSDACRGSGPCTCTLTSEPGPGRFWLAWHSHGGPVRLDIDELPRPPLPLKWPRFRPRSGLALGQLELMVWGSSESGLIILLAGSGWALGLWQSRLVGV